MNDDSLPPLGRAFFRHRPALILSLLLVTALSALGGSQLGFDFTPQRIFETSHGRRDDFAQLHQLRQTFGRDDAQLVIHLDAPRGLFQPDTLDYLLTLHRALEDTPGVTRVDDLTSAWVHPPGSLLPQPLLPRDPDLARQLALDEPLLAGRLLTHDATAALLVAHIDPSDASYAHLSPIIHACLDALADTPAPPDVAARPTGIPLARVQIVERLVRDQLTYLPMCTLLFIGILLALFRDLRATATPLFAVLIALVITTGTMGATGEPINIINNVLPVLIFVIGISDAIHLVTRYRRELTTSPQRPALWRALRHLAAACLLTSLTTAAGFASLLAADITILRRFGVYAAYGVLVAYATTMLVLPLVFSYLSPPSGSGGGRRADQRVDAWAFQLGTWSVRHRTPVLLGFAALIAAALYFASHVEENNQLYEAFPADDPIALANARIERDFAGVVPLALVVELPQPTPTADQLRALQDLQTLVDDSPAFGGALSLADLVCAWNAGRSFGNPQARTIPDTDPQVALALEQLRAQLDASGRGDLLDRLWSPEARLLRISAASPDAGAKALDQGVRDLQTQLDQRRDTLAELGLTASITGDGPVASRGINRLIHDLYSSLLLAFVLVTLTLAALLRSVRATLVAMIPNLFPLLLTLGFMGACGLDLRVTSVIVFTVSLGLAVDDTIHFMARLREEWPLAQRAPDPYARALRRTFRGTGSAIVATTLLLALGFCVLLFSAFPLTRTFAICMEVTIVGALLGDLLLLPACLDLIRPPLGRGRTVAPPAPAHYSDAHPDTEE